MRRAIDLRWHWLPLALVVGLAAGIRCYRLDAGDITAVEAFSWRLVRCPVSELIERTAADTHPPGYYLLLKAWVSVWGDSLAALRSLSVVFGVLGVVAVYGLCVGTARWGLQHAPERARRVQLGALLGCVLVGFDAPQIEYSRSARMYALGVLLAATTAWLAVKALSAPKRPAAWWGTYGLAVGAFCWTHN
ncbi:MAG TPA: hypothetical protein VFA18_01935, partial [Gemmataceae bacterium]|nr:hypothetical protein [Gemmataceae bacterium]